MIRMARNWTSSGPSWAPRTQEVVEPGQDLVMWRGRHAVTTHALTWFSKELLHTSYTHSFMMAKSDQSNSLDYDVLVIGAGLSGIFTLYRMQELGLRVRALEAGPGEGGTWFW